MSQDIKRIGDNQDPIQDQAIRLIKEIHENMVGLQKHTSEAWMGKNKTIRDNNALMSVVKSNKILHRFESWFKVVDAKANGVDVHSAPIKTHKLNIVAHKHNEFGQYLVDKNDTPKKPVQLELPFEEYK
jgi:hypothetical protein|tara:strand:+ start:914 stop:1300 length:387 start_codon:yes stop_codon:yes gene_type:complete